MYATRYLSRGQAARVLGVAMTTLVKWQTAGTLLPTIVCENGYRYYDQSEVERLAVERAEGKKEVAK